MMTRFVLTLLVGLVVSLGALVSGGCGVAWAGNWNLSEEAKHQANLLKHLPNWNDEAVCITATKEGQWNFDPLFKLNVEEAKRRGLSCGVGETIQAANIEKESHEINKICNEITYSEGVFDEKTRRFESIKAWAPVSYKPQSLWALQSVIKENIDCGVEQPIDDFVRDLFKNAPKYEICAFATFDNRTKWKTTEPYLMFVRVAHDRGEKCQTGVSAPIVSGFNPEDYFSRYASTPKAKPKVTSAALTAAEKEAERLRQRVAALEAEKAKQQQVISGDTKIPLITITQSGADGRKGSVKGYAKDNVQVAEVLIDGQAVRVGNDGSFEWSGFVPSTGKEITIEAIDTAALSSTKTVILKRGQIQQASGPRFDVLDPTAGKKVKRNSNALALIVGISDYERTDAPAVYADKDAQYFHDYASLKLGIPDSNIKTMVNAKAEQGDVILAVKDWMRRSSKPGKTDVYVFFAGHGLASDDGEQMYLLPYDGRPRLLDDTAILRDRLFTDITSANPRSVTVFLDTCYSGTTRGTDMLISSRPIAIKALEQSIPDNFTVMTAARGDQTAKPLEEAKHGMFSYFLMKGMEGEADQNQDNKITAGELHQYVQSNVVQQSSGSQTPELQGDADRVLVRFQ